MGIKRRLTRGEIWRFDWRYTFMFRNYCLFRIIYSTI